MDTSYVITESILTSGQIVDNVLTGNTALPPQGRQLEVSGHNLLKKYHRIVIETPLYVSETGTSRSDHVHCLNLNSSVLPNMSKIISVCIISRDNDKE